MRNLFKQAREKSLIINKPRTILWLVINIMLLAVCSIVVFNHNELHLLNGLDGTYVRLLVKEQLQWMPFGPHFSINPLQGMGNVFLPVNMNLIPIFSLQAWVSNGKILLPLSFTLFAMELMVSSWLLGSAFKMPNMVSIAGGWILSLLTLPFIWLPVFNPLYAMVPYCVDLIVLMSLIIWAFSILGGKENIHIKTIMSFLIVALTCFSIISNPLGVITIVPVMFLTCLMILISSTEKKTLLWKGISALLLILILIIGGFAEYLISVARYTTTAYFSNELFHHQAGLYHASIVFQSKSFSSIGMWLVIISVAGAIITLLTEKGILRYAAILHLILTGICVIGGWAIVSYLPKWRGPQMHYFETAVWPFYCLFAVMALLYTSKSFAYLCCNLLKIKYQINKDTIASSLLIFILITIISIILIRGMQSPVKDPSAMKSCIYPPSETSFIRILKSAISITPGSVYRGSVATFAGGDMNKGISWFDQYTFSAQLVTDTGNDHRLAGFWYYDIPTLGEYNQYITPPMYVVFTRLFARPFDPQMRNILSLTVPKPAPLAAFGVRFVVSDRELPSPFQKIETLMLVKGLGNLYLYELMDVNLGQYSPTKTMRMNNATDALSKMMSSNMNWKDEAIVVDEVPKKLVKASQVNLFMERGGFRIKAYADKESLIILPLQYSRCFSLKKNSTIRLIRVNLLQLGIIFSGSIDESIYFRSGPLGAASCRAEDHADMMVIDLKGVVDNFPLDYKENF